MAMARNTGEVNMQNRVRLSGGFAALAAAAAMFLLPSRSQAAINMLVNPSFEAPNAGGGDQSPAPGPSGWNGFNGAFITPATKKPGNQSLKALGTRGGASQDFPASPG